MVVGAEYYHAEKCARQSLERLTRDGLSPTPNNFSVFYYYYAESNPNLKMAIDLLLSQNAKLTQQQCDDLYQAHLGLEAEHAMLKETNNVVEEEMTRVLRVVDSAVSGTAEYSKTLDNFSGKLTSSISMEQVRDAVAKVAVETRSMAKQNERLATQLGLAMQQLTETRYNLDRVHKESQIDPLTEVGNRKFFERELGQCMANAMDDAAPLSLLMVDIDHFKKFNDTHGHLIGDQVLRLVARTLVENLKGRDVIARFGGEEFVILLPNTKVSDAEKVGNQLRASLGTKSIKRRSTNETLGVVTISIGATEFCPNEESDRFIARADKALYKAKQTGRNKVMSDLLSPEEIAEIQKNAPVIKP